MKLVDINNILQTEVVYQDDSCQDGIEVESACGADLMSDVLAFSGGKSLLLTGLTNPQVVRTAEMTDIRVIIFVRGKKPTSETIKLAREKGISLYATSKPLFECCGILYEKGLKPEEIERIE